MTGRSAPNRSHRNSNERLPSRGGSPFSADPKQMLAASSAFDPRSANAVYILNETTYKFDQDGHTKMTRHLIKRVVTEEGASQVGTISAYWAPWYEEKQQI